MERANSLTLLRQEFRHLQSTNSIPNITTSIGLLDESNIYAWKVLLLVRFDSLYKGGMFSLILNFSENYPMLPPKVKFQTPIYHLNVKSTRDNYTTDEIGTPNLNILKFWKPEYQVKDILISIYALFYMTNAACSYNLNMANEFINSRELYNKKVEYFTKKYANPLRSGRIQNWDFTYES